MYIIVFIFLIPLVIGLLVSRISPPTEDIDWEETNKAIKEFTDSLERHKAPKRDPHDNYTYRYLHRRDEEHERHRRNQWPL